MTDTPPPGYTGGSILPSPTTETPMLRVQGGGGPPPEYSAASILPQPQVRAQMKRIVGGGSKQLTDADYPTQVGILKSCKLLIEYFNNEPRDTSAQKVGGLFVLDEFNKVLTIQRKDTKGGNSIAAPGGLFDSNKDKTTLDTAFREFAEETGLKLPDAKKKEAQLFYIRPDKDIDDYIVQVKRSELQAASAKEYELTPDETQANTALGAAPGRDTTAVPEGFHAYWVPIDSVIHVANERINSFQVKEGDTPPFAVIQQRNYLTQFKGIQAILTAANPEELEAELIQLYGLTENKGLRKKDKASTKPTALTPVIPTSAPMPTSATSQPPSPPIPDPFDTLSFRTLRGDAMFKAGATQSGFSQIRVLYRKADAIPKLPPHYQVEEIPPGEYQGFVFVNEQGEKVDIDALFKEGSTTTQLQFPIVVLRVPYKTPYTSEALAKIQIVKSTLEYDVPLGLKAKKKLVATETTWTGSDEADGITFLDAYKGPTVLVGGLYRVRDPLADGVKEDIAGLRFLPAEFALFIKLGFNQSFIKDYILHTLTEREDGTHPFSDFWEQYVVGDCVNMEKYYTRSECLRTEGFLKELQKQIYVYRREDELQFLLGKKKRRDFGLATGKKYVEKLVKEEESLPSPGPSPGPAPGPEPEPEKPQVTVVKKKPVNGPTDENTASSSYSVEENDNESRLDEEEGNSEEENGEENGDENSSTSSVVTRPPPSGRPVVVTKKRETAGISPSEINTQMVESETGNFKTNEGYPKRIKLSQELETMFRTFLYKKETTEWPDEKKGVIDEILTEINRITRHRVLGKKERSWNPNVLLSKLVVTMKDQPKPSDITTKEEIEDQLKIRIYRAVPLLIQRDLNKEEIESYPAAGGFTRRNRQRHTNKTTTRRALR